MASWIEIERVRKDPHTFRFLARKLLGDPHCEETEFVDGFLENIANWKRDEISLRQCEVLLELRDSAEIHFRYRGLSISTLIIKCYEGRWGLDPVDRRRIENLYESGRGYVTGAQMGWFKRICKELGEMEDYM
jgi:DNA invertase Pin-like site-specific DNA recombinase